MRRTIFFCSSIIYFTHWSKKMRSNAALVSYQRLTQCQKSVSYTGPKIWNTIPDKIKSRRSIGAFKRNYKLYLLNSYNMTYADFRHLFSFLIYSSKQGRYLMAANGRDYPRGGCVFIPNILFLTVARKVRKNFVRA